MGSSSPEMLSRKQELNASRLVEKLSSKSHALPQTILSRNGTLSEGMGTRKPEIPLPLPKVPGKTSHIGT